MLQQVGRSGLKEAIGVEHLVFLLN